VTGWLDDPADSWDDAPDDPPRVDRGDVRREGTIVRDRVDGDRYIHAVAPVDVRR